MTFLTILGVMEILCNFRLVIEIPESSRLESLARFLANNFALSDAEDNTPRPLNRARGGTANLPLMRTLLAVCQKSRESSFSEVWQLQEPFCCLNFTLESEDLFFWYK